MRVFGVPLPAHNPPVDWASLQVSALSLDAAGTVVHPVEPIAATYASVSSRYGGTRSSDEIGAAFTASMRSASSGLRYRGDGKSFWRRVVQDATGVSDPACFEELYWYYAEPSAWRVPDGIVSGLRAWRETGRRAALLSDWDTRLRPLIDALGLTDSFDATIISAEVGLEKPDPRVFRLMCDRVQASPAETLHLGDSHRRDVEGARSAGLQAHLWDGRTPPLTRVVSALLVGPD